MKLRIVALGQRMPAWVDAAFEDYARRMPRELALELVEIKPQPRGRGRSLEQALAQEAKRIGAATTGWCVVALDERGEPWTTAHLAARLVDWRDRGEAVAFVIGSADGIAESIKRDADVIVALSALTLPHGLARVVLAEQLYRASCLLAGHPYHRE
ncbi:MAG TPA: 23S rRNA (pseudouridine(1915)-N(3))-methyltransferase RlmH [Casimicrobiaceae bacterium]